MESRLYDLNQFPMSTTAEAAEDVINTPTEFEIRAA
jgi:hypothetical protein